MAYLSDSQGFYIFREIGFNMYMISNQKLTVNQKPHLHIWSAIIFTIGHSNREIDEFLNLLSKNRIKLVVDIRRFPTSKFPHFRGENLKLHLQCNGIEYQWMKELGGYRKKIIDDSPNIAIKSQGFRNYADYMLTSEFESAIKKLESTALKKRTAIMCAERLYWRCHRKFISDFLSVRGWLVMHIMDDRVVEHRVSREARPHKGRLIYDKLD